MKYIKRPVLVEAVEFKGVDPIHKTLLFDEKPHWLSDALWSDTIIIRENGDLAIRTLEGIMTAKRGYFIIRGVEGEIYACEPSIFIKTYEEAEIR